MCLTASLLWLVSLVALLCPGLNTTSAAKRRCHWCSHKMFYIHFSGIHFIVTECRNLLVGIFYFLYGTRVEHTALTFPLRLNNPASKQQIICVLAHFVPINFCLFSPVKLQLQATSVGEVVIKGVCANRYLAMNRDGRLFGAVSYLIHTFCLEFWDDCKYCLSEINNNNNNKKNISAFPEMVHGVIQGLKFSQILIKLPLNVFQLASSKLTPRHCHKQHLGFSVLKCLPATPQAICVQWREVISMWLLCLSQNTQNTKGMH